MCIQEETTPYGKPTSMCFMHVCICICILFIALIGVLRRNQEHFTYTRKPMGPLGRWCPTFFFCLPAFSGRNSYVHIQTSFEENLLIVCHSFSLLAGKRHDNNTMAYVFLIINKCHFVLMHYSKYTWMCFIVIYLILFDCCRTLDSRIYHLYDCVHQYGVRKLSCPGGNTWPSACCGQTSPCTDEEGTIMSWTWPHSDHIDGRILYHFLQCYVCLRYTVKHIKKNKTILKYLFFVLNNKVSVS